MSRSILIVDDDRQMVRTLADLVRLKGWRATGVHSGEAAVEAVGRERFSAVLMDVKMEGIDGVEALKRMRALRPGMPVILMTAYTAAELLDEAMRAGAIRVLSKPVAVPELIEMLARETQQLRPVLIVDDDPDFLHTLADLVRSRGRPVMEAEDLDHAVELLHERAPLAVVLDLRLDDIAPPDSIVAIKRVNPAVLLILYSGSPALLAETARAVPSSWVHACLEKPFQPNQLIEIIDALEA